MDQQTDQQRQRYHPLAIWHWPLHWQVLVGIVLGVIAGLISGLLPEPGRFDFFLYDLVGDIFKNGLKMIIVPLVAVSIVTAIGSLSTRQGFARLGGKTLLYYLSTSLAAILIGLCLVNLIAPGAGIGFSADEAREAVAVPGSTEAAKMAYLEERTAGRGLQDAVNVIKEIVPSNVVAAAADTKMLGVIFFSLLVGFYLSRLQGRPKEVLDAFFAGGYEIMFGITMLVLRFLPIGVLCLIAATTAEAVADDLLIERLLQLSKFAITVLLALGLHMFVVLPLILRFIGGVNPLRQFQAMGPALLTAFSTASSSATLPLTMECVEHNARVSKRVTSFVIPVGATVNMDGTALYECVAVIFLAQLAGIPLGFADQFLIVLLALLTSIGVAGIPSASLVAIVIILGSVNAQLPADQQIPPESLAIILIFDRLLDMCRTALNVFGDSCGAVTIARTEGEDQVLQELPDLHTTRP